MSRNLSELKAECEARGLKVVKSGNREAKADYESALRDSFWKEEFPGVEIPPQYTPMLAFDYKNLVPEKMNAHDPDPAFMMKDGNQWAAQEKMQGARLLLHVGCRSDEHDKSSWIHSRRISDENYRLADNSGNFIQSNYPFPLEWRGAVLDGEALSCRPDINTGDTLTQNIEKATVALCNCAPEKSMQIQAEQGYMKIFIFDCLFGRCGKDLRKSPYRDRLVEATRFVKMCKEMGLAHIEVLPVVLSNKEQFYGDIVTHGGEGVMLKDLNSKYEHKRTRSMYKHKKFVEVDGWVSGFVKSDPEAGWSDLIGALEFSAYDENGKVHVIAACANLTMEDRKLMTFNPGSDATLNPEYLGKIAAIRGMEWSSRNYRMSNARIERWRDGVDLKPKEECVIDWAAVITSVHEHAFGSKDIL